MPAIYRPPGGSGRLVRNSQRVPTASFVGLKAAPGPFIAGICFDLLTIIDANKQDNDNCTEDKLEPRQGLKGQGPQKW